MKKASVLFDVDGVIFDIEHFMFKFAKDFFKETWGLEIVNPNGYGIKEIFNCTDEQQDIFWEKHAVKYFMLYSPRLDVVKMIKTLQSEGNKISLFTEKMVAGNEKMKPVIETVFRTGLKIHNINVDDINIFFSDEYNNEKVCDKKKLSFLEQNHFDIVVEDKRANVLEFSRLTNVLCMASKNNNDIVGSNITMVHNANQIYTAIKKIEDKINETASIFTTFEKRTKEERILLSPSELKTSYEELKEYVMNLPFDEKHVKKAEVNFKIISHLLEMTFAKKYETRLLNAESIPHEKGRIFISNHVCDKDFFLILSTFKGIVWHPLIKNEILDEMVGLLFKMTESIFVDRKDAYSRKNATLNMLKFLLRDFDILIFPEGTYTSVITENEILAPYAGLSPLYLSQVTGKKIVPIALPSNYNKGVTPIINVGEFGTVSIEEDLNIAKEKLWETHYKLVKETDGIASQMIKRQR